MIYFDVTQTGAAAARSGLTRVNRRLLAEFGPAAVPAVWRDGTLRRADNAAPVVPGAADWFLTAELFSEAERPGFAAFLAARRLRCAALFHDAIPLKHPHITWPKSVARHPAYLKQLAAFDRIFAVSAASRDELLGYWRWLGLATVPPVAAVALGADAAGTPRITVPVTPPAPPQLLCLGIVEPRKNQALLLAACAALWREGRAFELHVVGRMNPHFGRPIVAALEKLRAEVGPRLVWHAAADDAAVAARLAAARATVFPTLAEGCGLPLLESLWHGVPCVCSDLPVLRENADAGGCLAVPVGDVAAWTAALRRILADDTLHRDLAAAAVARPLPTWADTAAQIRSALR